MLISIHQLRACLNIAAKFSEAYAVYVGAGGGPLKSRDDLLYVARKLVGKEIEVFELDEPLAHESIIGFYVAEEEGYSIVLSSGNKEDLIRFVLCKELFHVLLDQSNSTYRSTDVCSHLDEIAVTFPVKDSEPGPAVVSEVLAEIGAMEFLFPYAARIEELKANPVDFKAIAEKYRIPQYLVETYLHPEYMTEIGAMLNGGKAYQ